MNGAAIAAPKFTPKLPPNSGGLKFICVPDCKDASCCELLEAAEEAVVLCEEPLLADAAAAAEEAPVELEPVAAEAAPAAPVEAVELAADDAAAEEAEGAEPALAAEPVEATCLEVVTVVWLDLIPELVLAAAELAALVAAVDAPLEDGA